MSEAVVTADPDQITELQNYLHTFNKEIGDNQNTAISTTGSTNANSVYTYSIDGKEITGNLVVSNAATTNEENNGENYQIMVMNNQQYMLIVSSDGEQAATNEQTLLLTSEQANGLSTQLAEVETPKRTRGMFRNKAIKEEIVEEERNDLSVYDFNDQPNRNNATATAVASASPADATAQTPTKNQTLDDDPDFKTPTKTRGRPIKSESGRKQKSPSGTSTNASPSVNNLHSCTYCTYSSTKRYLLSRHLKSHSEDRPHKCGICERGFKTLASLQNHVNTHTGVRPHQCKFCEAAFTTSGELVRHIRYRHTHEKPHRCSECDYASVELSKLKRHMRCHTGERPYQCPHCTYASPDTYKLKRHLRIHTGEKPYICDVCHQRFTQSNSLKAHKLIHTGNKPIFKCEFCPTTCGRKTDLRIHVQKLHTSDKILTCRRCDQSFPDRYQFKLHLKTHEGEKCFKCELCTYASVSSRHLESHMLIHTDQKPYICENCHLSFRQKQLLKRHKNLYHNPNYVPPVPKEKTHECSQCNKTFRHKGNLIRHMSIHDPDSKNNVTKDLNSLNQTQLIDEEIYEGEEDYDASGNETTMVVTDNSILDSSSVGDTISITLDPQTHHDLINEQVMLVVVPNSEADAVASSNGQQTIVTVAPTASTPRIISRSGRVTRSLTKNNEIFDVVETKPIINETPIQTDSSPFDQSVGIRIQKQKDMATCFGFKDDDEDDVILSMPAAHGE